MEELYDQNILRGLGVSNFYEDRLIDLIYHANVRPVVNQIECHPFNQRKSPMGNNEKTSNRWHGLVPFHT